MRPWGGLGTYLGVLVESLETPWGSLVALEVSLDDSLGDIGGCLGSPCRGLVLHMVRTQMFQRFLCFVALA